MADGLQRSLQQEWAFMQCTTKGLGDDFQTIDKALREDFILVLFIGKLESMPVQKTMVLLVK